MKSKILVATLLLMFTGCDVFRGQLRVDKTLTLTIKEDGRSDCRNPFDRECRMPRPKPEKKVIQIEPNSYTAEVRPSGKSSVTLTITDKNKKKNVIELKVADGQKLPEWDGPFKLQIPDTTYIAEGSLHTSIEDSGQYSGHESCTYRIQVRVCKDVIDDNGRRRQECHLESETRYGHQWVTYFNRYTTKDLGFAINEANAPEISAALAGFQGRSTSTDKIYTYQGPCN